MKNLLQKLIENSDKAIENGVYHISDNLTQSKIDLTESIKTNNHASLITEIKFSSPSLGKIRQKTDPILIAKSMLKGGAVGLSVLTQPYFFDGSPEIFMKIRKEVNVPMLMKDVIIDKVQIDAAEKIGADFILLIQSFFEKKYLKDLDEFIDHGHKKGLKILLETHTKKEFSSSLETSADIIGINNRNLDTLSIDINTTKTILENYDKSKIVITESGIENTDHIRFLHKCGADAFLVGSSIMKSDNIEDSVRKLVRVF